LGKRSGAARGWAEGWPRPPLPRHEVPPSLGQATSGLPWPRRRLQAAGGAASWGAARPAAGTILCFTCVCIRIRAFKCVAVTPAWPPRCFCKSSPPGTTRRIDTKKCQKSQSCLQALSAGADQITQARRGRWRGKSGGRGFPHLHPAADRSNFEKREFVDSSQHLSKSQHWICRLVDVGSSSQPFGMFRVIK